MGQEVLYCSKCQLRLVTADFEKGATRIENHPYCRKCAPAALEALPPDKRKSHAAGLTAGLKGSSTKVPSVPESSSGAGPVRTIAIRGQEVPNMMIPILIGTVILVLVIAGLVSSSGKPVIHEQRVQTPHEVVVEPPPAPSPKPPSEPLRVEPAPPKPELDPALRKAKEEFAVQLQGVREEMQTSYKNEEFGRARTIVEGARQRRPEPEWGAEIEKILSEIQAAAQRAYGPLKESALGASRRGAQDELKALKDRLAKWGLPDYSADLTKALAEAPAPAPAPAPTPAVPPPTKEPEVANPRWTAAMLQANLRDYPGALAALESLAASIKEEASRKPIQADLEALRLAQTVPAEALAALAKWPADQELAIEIYDENGAKKTVSGIPGKPEGSRLALKKGPTTIVIEMGEISPGALATVFLAKRGKKLDADVRAAATFCLIEGDPDAASGISGAVALPENLLALSRKISEARVDPNSPEGRARAHFYAAEREFYEYSKRADAVQKYKALLKEGADTAFVRRNRASITGRGESGKEFVFFPMQLTGAGTLRIMPDAKGEPIWTSGADTGKERTKDNFLQISFSTLPETVYKCWVYAGGCCGETFGFFLQADELTGPSSDGKETVSMAPGEEAYLQVKHALSPGSKHASHGGPKQPSKWAWISIPLPKFSTPGPKKVRILTNQQGFSVAYAIVSSTRQSPPMEAEIKRMPKPSGLTPLAMGLEAHWKFDEGKGNTVADSSGKGLNGTFVRGVQWSEGKFGSAVRVERDNYVQVLTAESLSFRASDSFSVSLWANVTGGGGWRSVFAKSRDIKPHYGLWVSNSNKWFFGGNEKGIEGCAVTPGWHHVVFLQNAASQDRALYVDGVKCGAGPAADANGSGELRIGAAKSVSEYFYGSIDEIRVYSRALTPAEITMLGQTP